MGSKKKHKACLNDWSSFSKDESVVLDDDEAKVVDRSKPKRKGPEPIRTFFLGDEIDGKELLLSRPLRKQDILGGRKMVFYQYTPELYNPKGVSFAGRRKSEKTSKYRGVYWNKNHGKWEVKVKFFGKTHSLGFFETEERAARVYDRSITKFIINRLAINFPEDIGGVKLTIADLVTDDTESIAEANERVKTRVHKKVQDLALNFGLDDPEEVANGCSEWPSKAEAPDEE